MKTGTKGKNSGEMKTQKTSKPNSILDESSLPSSTTKLVGKISLREDNIGKAQLVWTLFVAVTVGFIVLHHYFQQPLKERSQLSEHRRSLSSHE